MAKYRLEGMVGIPLFISKPSVVVVVVVVVVNVGRAIAVASSIVIVVVIIFIVIVVDRHVGELMRMGWENGGLGHRFFIRNVEHLDLGSDTRVGCMWRTGGLVGWCGGEHRFLVRNVEHLDLGSNGVGCMRRTRKLVD